MKSHFKAVHFNIIPITVKKDNYIAWEIIYKVKLPQEGWDREKLDKEKRIWLMWMRYKRRERPKHASNSEGREFKKPEVIYGMHKDKVVQYRKEFVFCPQNVLVPCQTEVQ